MLGFYHPGQGILRSVLTDLKNEKQINEVLNTDTKMSLCEIPWHEMQKEVKGAFDNQKIMKVSREHPATEASQTLLIFMCSCNSEEKHFAPLDCFAKGSHNNKNDLNIFCFPSYN